jgi:hypothetical protein
MTERPARFRRPPAAPVIWSSISLFAVLFVLFTYQLSSGAVAGEPRHVLERKVIAKRVVKTIVPTEEDDGASAPAPPPAEYVAPEPEYVAPEVPVVTSSS